MMAALSSGVDVLTNGTKTYGGCGIVKFSIWQSNSESLPNLSLCFLLALEQNFSEARTDPSECTFKVADKQSLYYL